MSTCEINHYHTKSNHCHKRHVLFYMINIWSLKTETRSILKKQIKLYILQKQCTNIGATVVFSLNCKIIFIKKPTKMFVIIILKRSIMNELPLAL